MRIRRNIVAALPLLLVLAGCGGDSSDEATSETDETTAAVSTEAVEPTSDSEPGELESQEGTTAATYLRDTAPRLLERSTEIDDMAESILEEEVDYEHRSYRIGDEVVPLVRDLLDDAEAYVVGTGRVADVHQDLLAALSAELESYEALAAAEDEYDLARAVTLRSSVGPLWDSWFMGVESLME